MNSGELMKNSNVTIEVNKLYKQKLFSKIVQITALLLLLISSIIYLFLYIVHDGGRFTISLDKNMSNNKSVYLSEDGSETNKTRELFAETIDNMDNISIKWLPENLHEEANGVHNGDNYIAYTFYVVNAGKETVNYWYEVEIDDVIKNVDEAVRIMVFRNGVKTVYAKINADTLKEEEGTKAFYSKDIAVLEQRKNFEPGNIDKYTIVVWLEGDDPDCVNAIIGGELKMHMDITEEHFEEVVENENNDKEEEKK